MTLAREERRLATVVFIDVSGFTALSERLDPEEVKAFANQSARAVTRAIRQFGGTVLQVVGDEVFAVFGVPVAHEDDAERAVRAGLAVRHLSLETGQVVQAHAGINTGEVMAGFVGPDDQLGFTVMGDVVNTAARLRAAAPAGTVWVAEATYRASRHTIRYQAVPPVAAKGKEKPVPAWEAIAVSEQPGARAFGDAPFIGRDRELADLQGLWQRVVTDRQPTLVTILGEPGLGKSRLSDEFEHRLAGASSLVLHGRCFPYGEARAFGAFAAQVREAIGLTSDDTPAAARGRLTMLVQSLGPWGPTGEAEFAGREVPRQLALLAGLDMPEDRQTEPLDPRLVFGTARRFLEALARRQPVCLIFDDLHWADETLLDLIEYVAARARGAPLLVLTQARPELLTKRPGWGGAASASRVISLAPLEERHEWQLLEALTTRHRLHPELPAAIGGRAGGNPLFVEELVQMVAEGGALEGMPNVIKLLISARLDVLPPDERRVLQVAAIFGKVFWEDGVAALATGTEPRAMLSALEVKDLVRTLPRSQLRGQLEYAFKHDLIRDVAYDLLPRAERRVLHGQAVNWLEATATGQVDVMLDQLVHHTLGAGQLDRAIGYLRRAAAQASRASAHRRAASLLNKAIELAGRLEQPALAAELQADRGTALVSVGLWAEARPALEAALQALPRAAPGLRAETLLHLAVAHFWLLDMPSMLQRAGEALAEARLVRRDDLAATALATIASGRISNGDLAGGLELYEEARRNAVGQPQGRSPAWSIHGLAFYWMGRPAEAIPRAQAAVEAARHDTSNLVYSLANLGLAHMGLGEYGEAERFFQEAEQIGREYEVLPFLARAQAMSAGWRLDLHDLADHWERVQAARELARTVNFAPAVVSTSIDLLFNYARRGEIASAEALVPTVADSVRDAAGSHGWLWRLRLATALAEIALARAEWDQAIEQSTTALEAARLRRRLKYIVLSLLCRARALQGAGKGNLALRDIRETFEAANAGSDPALLVHAGAALQALTPDDRIITVASHAAQRILAALPDDSHRDRVRSVPAFKYVLNS